MTIIVLTADVVVMSLKVALNIFIYPIFTFTLVELNNFV